MKNKIRCLFDKITSEDLFGIFGICIFALLIFTMVYAPLTASAYDDSIFPYTFTITNPLNVSHSTVNVTLFNQTWHTEQNVLGNSLTATRPIGSSIADMVVTINENEVSITGIGVITDFENEGIPYGNYNVLFYANVVSDYVTIVSPHGNIPTATLIGATDDGFLGMYVYNENDFISSGQYQLISNNSPIDGSITQLTMVLLPITDEPSTDTCPTLEEQIANYNGTWSSLVDKIQANNNTLYGEYISTLYSWRDDGANSVTLEQRLSEFDGDWQDFERLMAEYNVNLQSMYTYYVNSLETQAFEDGMELGRDEGYNVGKLDGYNKGASDTLVQNFFGNFLQGVVQAIDAIHIYEIIDDKGTLDVEDDVVEFYISPWSILIVFIGLALVLIFLKVWRGG